MQRLLTRREKVIFYVTVSLIVFSIVFNFLIGPILRKNDALNREINIMEVRLKKYLKLLSQKENIQNKYSKLALNSDLFGQQGDTLVASLSELENLAKNANIRIIDIRPQNIPKGSDLYQAMTVDIRTEGEMKNYLKFIYDLENSLSLLRIKRFQLRSKPNTQILEGSFSIFQISATE